jgi:hypothetical protein
MPVEVRVSNGSESIVKKVWISSEITFVTADIGSEPTIEIDPPNHILKGQAFKMK